MKRPSRAVLHAYAVGALDPGRERDVADELASSAELRGELADVRVALRGAARSSAWRVPPPGIPSGRSPFAARAEAAAVMGQTVAPGDRVLVRLGPVHDTSAFVVVLYRRDLDWEVAFPLDPDDAAQVSDLDADPVDAATRVLDLVARGEVGEQRFAIALVPSIDWSSADRWAAVRDGVASGDVPITAVRIYVRASG